MDDYDYVLIDIRGARRIDGLMLSGLVRSLIIPYKTEVFWLLKGLERNGSNINYDKSCKENGLVPFLIVLQCFVRRTSGNPNKSLRKLKRIL